MQTSSTDRCRHWCADRSEVAWYCPMLALVDQHMHLVHYSLLNVQPLQFIQEVSNHAVKLLLVWYDACQGVEYILLMLDMDCTHMKRNDKVNRNVL